MVLISFPEMDVADNFYISGNHLEGILDTSERQMTQLWMEKHGLSQVGLYQFLKDCVD